MECSILIHDISVYNLRFELNLPVRTSSLIFNLPKCNSTCWKKYHNEWFYHIEEYSSKFQLVHLGKLAKNQLARSQNLLVTDEQTSVKIFTDIWSSSTPNASWEWSQIIVLSTAPLSDRSALSTSQGQVHPI